MNQKEKNHNFTIVPLDVDLDFLKMIKKELLEVLKEQLIERLRCKFS